MLAFQFGSNLPIILLIIVILLVCLYFYLDMRKVKVLLENLDNKNEIIVKEIDNIHLQMHKFFSRMPQSIVPRKVDPKMPKNIVKKEPTEQILKEESEVSEELNQEKEKKPHLPKDTTEISENDFNNLKKQPHSNNIFGEVEEMISNNNNNNNFLGDESEPIEPPPLVPFEYDTADKLENDGNDDDDDDEVGITDDDDDDEVDDEVEDEVEDVDGEIDLLPDNKDNNIDEYKLEEYMKMSVKGLKAKCIEMNLQHSGNKSTLAKRIVVNLK